MPSEAAVSTFLDELYDAAIFPQRWPDAVAGFRNLLREEFNDILTHMTLIDLATGESDHTMISGADPDLLRQGADHYFRMDTYVGPSQAKSLEALRRGEKSLILVSNEIVPRTELESTEFYNDFLRHFGIRDMLGATSIVAQSKVLNLVANPIHSRDFEQRDRELVSQLLPHVDRAFRMSVKLGFAEAGKAVSYLWENSQLPVMVVQQGRLTYANASAERVLGMSGLVAKSGAGLVFCDDNANAALRSLSRVTQQDTRARQTAMELHDGNGEAWMLQMVRMNPPREDPSAQIFSIDPGIFVMLTPLNTASAVRAGSIDSIATFTAMEKELLHALVDGQSIQQIARRTGRGEATLRWHVRNLLSKSGLKNMTDLIRFASLLLPF